jgi:hypothetical protein
MNEDYQKAHACFDRALKGMTYATTKPEEDGLFSSMLAQAFHRELTKEFGSLQVKLTSSHVWSDNPSLYMAFWAGITIGHDNSRHLSFRHDLRGAIA